MRKVLTSVVAAWLIFLMASCSSVQLTKVWMDPSYDSPPLQKIMIIAFRSDEIERRMWEDAMVNAVGEQKTATSAVPSYRFFPHQVPPPDSVEIAVKDQNFDGVLVVAEVVFDTLTHQGPGYTTTEKVVENRNRTYVTRYKEVYHPGQIDTAMIVSVQTDLFLPQTDGGQLVWSGTSESIDLQSPEVFRADVAGAVAKQLSKAGLIP